MNFFLKFAAYLLLTLGTLFGVGSLLMTVGVLIIAYPEAASHTKVVLISLGFLSLAAVSVSLGFTFYSSLIDKARNTKQTNIKKTSGKEKAPEKQWTLENK